MLAGKAEIEALIPHAGAMCLLDELLAWDPESIRCLARSHRDAANPMRLGDELASLCGIEYAAQAMALHGRLTVQATTPQAGYLASVRDVTCHVARLDDLADDLVIEARKLMGDEAHVVYGFSLSAGARPLLEGRAAVVLDAAR
jgi:predicted hotdog family 3-hydroxylacyl-ACP dehydratase